MQKMTISKLEAEIALSGLALLSDRSENGMSEAFENLENKLREVVRTENETAA